MNPTHRLVFVITQLTTGAFEVDLIDASSSARQSCQLLESRTSQMRDAFEAAEPTTVHLITRYRHSNVNLRTQLLRIIGRAGLRTWPKLFVNLRSSRETELAESYPMHVVTAWLGNSPDIAPKHYLQVTEDHFERAAKSHQKVHHNPHQQTDAPSRTNSQDVQDESHKCSDDGELCELVLNSADQCESIGPISSTPCRDRTCDLLIKSLRKSVCPVIDHHR